MTIQDLVVGMVLVSPVVAGCVELHKLGGGLYRYATAAPIAVAMGFASAWIDWKIGKSVWFFTAEKSDRVKTAGGLLCLVCSLTWVVIGLLGGSKLASIIVRNVGY